MDIPLLHLREFQELAAHNRRPNEPLSDREVALRIAQQEREAFAQFNSDRTLAQQLQAEGDPRLPAFVHNAVDNTDDNTRSTANQIQASGSNWSIKSFFSWFKASSPNIKTNSQPKLTQTPRRLTGHNCVICQEAIYDVEIRAPCGHHYDKSCIQELFEASTRDESLFPPRCCRQNIPLASVETHISPAFLKTFRDKAVEFRTLKRVYCSNLTCSKFLCAQTSYSYFFSSAVSCPVEGCNATTCSVCKSRMISGTQHSCKPDSQEAAVLALGDRSGWARCPGCEQLIELNLGCYHMTCICKTEFCYRCRSRWKTCQCPQWDETRLLRAAEARVEAQLGARLGANRPIAQVVNPPRLPQRRVPVPTPPRPQVQLQALETTQRQSGNNTTVHASTTRTTSQLTRPGPSNSRSPSASTHRTTVPAMLPLYQDVVSPPPPYATIVRATTSNVARTLNVPGNGLLTPRSTRVPPIAEIQPTRPAISPRIYPRNPVSQTERDRLVRLAVEDLRVNHECSHQRWHYRSGGGKCENCHHHLPLYLFRCGGCQILACNRCRRNRM